MKKLQPPNIFLTPLPASIKQLLPNDHDDKGNAILSNELINYIIYNRI